MHRELNPQLFGPKTPSSSSSPFGTTNGLSEPTSNLPQAPVAGGPHATTVDVKRLEAQFNQLKLQFQASEKRNEFLVSQMQELARSTTGRFERVSAALTRLESSASQQMQEINAKYSAIASKVNERKVQDAKVQEMIDRHNNIVRAFENRLTHLQRVISEQEMQLHNSAASLAEAHEELARLKRL